MALSVLVQMEVLHSRRPCGLINLCQCSYFLGSWLKEARRVFRELLSKTKGQLGTFWGRQMEGMDRPLLGKWGGKDLRILICLFASY